MRFTTRDLLWFTVVVALALGWGVSYANWLRRQRVTKRHAEALRMALNNAETNITIYKLFPVSEVDERVLPPVYWELATREIP
jgi:hypothetical protein